MDVTDHTALFEDEDHFKNIAQMIETYFEKDLRSNRLDNIPKNRLMYMFLISRFIYIDAAEIPPYQRNSDGLLSLDVKYGKHTKAYQKVLDFASAILRNRLDICDIEKFIDDIEETDLAPDVYVAVKEVLGLITDAQENTYEIEYMFNAVRAYYE